MPFSLFKTDPRKKLQKTYEKQMKDAMEAMRRGDVKTNAELFAMAEATKAEIDELDAGARTNN